MGRRVAAKGTCVVCKDEMPLVFVAPTLMRQSAFQAVCGGCKTRYQVRVSIPRERVAGQVKVDMEAIRG